MGFLGKLVSADERHLSKAKKQQAAVLALEEEYASLTDEQLKEKTPLFKSRIEKGESLESILPEAFATAREAAKRVISEFPYPVQILGGILLHFGDIAEMKTGEGKTLTATMPIYLNALEGKGAHVITVNEYLAMRDANWMGEIFRFLGLTVGCNGRELDPMQKREAYACDITYTTNAELGFDYLRDNMVMAKEARVQRGLHYALIDEVDSVLVDEARTPLIISGPGPVLAQEYGKADGFAKSLSRENDVTIDKEDNSVTLTETGIQKAEKYYKIAHIYNTENAELVHYIQNALRANYLMNKDVEYVIGDDEIILVDQFTGRKMEGREFSDGLHQAIQAKEGVGIKQETITLATITYQNFFRLYDKLSGMTGTAKTEEKEFLTTYNMRVFEIPTNRPVIRVDYPDEIFKTKGDKYRAIVQEVKELYGKGQPVLVGTLSVGMSESLSQMMKKEGIVHQVLNAKEDAKEAEIVAKAGQRKAVTIATNMAGRGTDIKLGEGVKELGGLVVLGSERHESKRIDNQLRGRSGRQGDPGYSKFFCSTEDDIVERYATENAKETLEDYCNDKVRVEKIRTLMDAIQSRAEGLHYDTRQHVLEYDDVLMEQRRLIYRQRDEVLDMESVRDLIHSLNNQCIQDLCSDYNESKQKETFKEALTKLQVEENCLEDFCKNPNEKKLAEYVWSRYEEKAKEHSVQMNPIEKRIFLLVLDRQWMEYVDTMDRVKKGIYLRQYAQTKPLDAFKEEAFERFNNMMRNVSDQTTYTLETYIGKIEE